MYQKYVNSLPLYRQEQDFKRLFGIDISRSTIANWIIKNAEFFFSPMCGYWQRKEAAVKQKSKEQEKKQDEKPRKPEQQTERQKAENGSQEQIHEGGNNGQLSGQV